MRIQTIIKNSYKLVFFVLTAFLIMTMLSYFYVSTVVKKQIDLYSRAEIMGYQSSLRSLIQANEDALLHASLMMSMSLSNNGKTEDQIEILKNLTEVISTQDDIRKIFLSIFCFVDGNFMDISGTIPGSLFNPKTASWLRGATITKGIYHTKPYMDPRSNKAVGALSLVIYDNKDESRGVIAIDFYLEPIIDEVSSFKVTDSGFGLLVDSSMTLLNYPTAAYVGEKIDIVPGLEGIDKKLLDLKDNILTERIILNGEEHIGFFSHLENGWYLGNIVPISFYYGEVFALFPVILGISIILATFLSIMLLRLTMAKTRSEEESQFKSSFLARMSHEIRTPMNAIIGLTELANRDYGKPECRSYIGEIRRAGGSLLAIINDILDFSKIESGKYQLVNEPYEINRLLSDVISITEIRIKNKPIEFSAEIGNSVPSALLGDEKSIRQVLVNILSNAIKYTERGFVKLLVSSNYLDKNHIHLSFSVLDSGIGIKNEDMEKMFGDFVRFVDGDNSHRHIEGTGLGLSITNNLCHLMKGNLTVESEYGVGSTFTATIPQEIVDPTPLEKITKEINFPQSFDNVPFIARDFKVLLVDDIETNLMVAKGLFAPFKMQITTCHSGALAIEAAKNENFNLMLIDHMMPVMDGIITLRKIRELGGIYQKVPAVAFTANAISGVRENLIKNGFDDYISKPIETKEFMELLDKWVPEEFRSNYEENEQEHEKQVSFVPIEDSFIKNLEYPGFEPLIGLKRSGNSVDNYRKLLNIFVSDVEKELSSIHIKDGKISDTMDNLAIAVHALKSASANIGAMKLSNEAYYIEKTAMNNNYSIINNGSLFSFKKEITDFSMFIKVVLNQFQEKSNTSLNTIALSIDDLDALGESIESYNTNKADKLIEKMSFAADAASKTLLDKISYYILVADYDKAYQIVDKMKSTQREVVLPVTSSMNL